MKQDNKAITSRGAIASSLDEVFRKKWRPRMQVPQLALSPSLITSVPVKKLTSAQRRAAKIAAGKLKIEDGKLIGPKGEVNAMWRAFGWDKVPQQLMTFNGGF